MGVGIVGEVEILIDGVRVCHVRNLVVDSGLQSLADLAGGFAYPPTHIVLGTGVAAVNAADVALAAEKFRGTITRRERRTSGIEFQLFVPKEQGNTFTYSEVGLIESGAQNSGVGDPQVLIGRALLSPTVVKTASVELTAIYRLTYGAV